MLCSLFLIGCSAHQVSDSQYLHSLTVGFDGEPFDIEKADGANQVPDGPLDDFDKQLALIEETICATKPKRILIFIHGGLNTLSNGLERTDTAVSHIERWNEKHPDKSVYPIFINWHSRFVTFYDRHFRIRQGRYSPIQSWLTAPFTLVADFGRALARLPATMTTETQCAVGNLSRHVACPPDAWPNITIKKDYEIGTGDRIGSALTQVVPGVLRIGTMFLTDAALYESYQMMLRRIDMLFRTEADYEKAGYGPGQPSNGAISKLMQRIPEIQTKSGAKLELMGHSMGAIAVNEVVRRHPNLKFDKIVYMAAACSSSDFMNTIPPYLSRQKKPEVSKFYSLMLHPFADKDEAFLYSAFPRGSLLEWLDNYALTVKTPLDRTFGKWDNASRVLPMLHKVPDDVRERMFFKGFPVRGTLFPYNHGDFDEFPYWNPCFWDPKFDKPLPRIR